jgi:iron complex outermembrane recepter protein
MLPVVVAFIATTAQAEPRYFDIAPQKLATALREFGLQSGEQIAFRFETIAAVSTPGLHGTYEPDAALRALLNGTQLSFRRSGDGFVVVRDAVVPRPGPEVAPASGPPTPSAEELSEVHVTASRVVRSGFTAPTPTTVVSSLDIQQRGLSNIGDALNENLAFRPTTTPSTNGVRAIFPGAHYADLRGLTASRTLVLVGGKRFVPQITSGLPGYQVDLNQIPSLLLDHAEVVTGGASAQWGSDAVAGVVNLILKHDVQGISAEVQAGESELHDDRQYRVGVLAGTAFAEGRGHVQAALDLVRNQGVGDVYTRSWGRQGWQVISNPCPLNTPVSAVCPKGGNGQASNLILPDIRYSTETPGGLINSGPLRGMQFAPDGSLTPFIYGNYVGSQNMQGGGSNAGLNIDTGLSMVPAVTRRSLYARSSYDVTDSTEIYLEASYAYSEGSNQTLPARDTAIKIYADNAFLPDSVRQYLVANNLGSFDLGRSSSDLGYQEGDVVNETPRLVIGVDGVLGASWQWDAAYTFGMNHYIQHVANDRVIYKFNAATDAVAENGTIVCRSLLPGCVPLDVLGEGAPSAAAQDYVTDTLWSRTDYTQHAASFNLNGVWHSLSIATGVEWRLESQDTRVDPQAEQALYESTNAKSFTGRFNVTEGYLEAVAPLFSDRLDLNGALRLTDYSTSGFVSTWKLGTTFSPVRGLLLRAVYSKDIRAPNLFELYSPAVSTVMNVRLGQTQPAVESLAAGNPDLEPEVSHTRTLGVAWSALNTGLQLSLDYFDIDVTGAIGSVTSQQIADFCTQGQQAYCQRLIPNLHSFADYTVITPYINYNEVQRTGYDLAAAYRTELSRWLPGAPGVIAVALDGTYWEHNRENPGNGFVERAGQSNVTPRVLAVGSLSYSVAHFSSMAQLRYIGHGKFDSTYVQGVDINNNSVPSAVYLNLSTTVSLSDRLEIFGGVDNALNRAPPIDPTSFGLPTTPIYFDTVGRNFRLGLRYRP